MWVLKVNVIAWPWPKVVYIQKFKLFFLRNYCANLNQTLYESFQVQGNENLMTWCWSHDKDGRHSPIWQKSVKNLPRNPRADFHETWYVALGTQAHHSLFKWWPWFDLDLFYGRVKFCYWKQWRQRIFQKLLQPVTWKLVDTDNYLI